MVPTHQRGFVHGPRTLTKPLLGLNGLPCDMGLEIVFSGLAPLPVKGSRQCDTSALLGQTRNETFRSVTGSGNVCALWATRQTGPHRQEERGRMQATILLRRWGQLASL